MWKLLSSISKHLIIAIPVMMLLGFVFGIAVDDASGLKGLIIPFTFLMVYPMMVNLKIKKVFEGGDVKAQLLTQAINFGIIPFVAFGLGMLFFRDSPYMALGMLLAGLVPTSGMTISWTGFAKGNVASAVKMTVIGLTLGSLATPFYVQFLMGASLEVNVMAVMKQIVIIVFIPMLAGFLTQQGLIKRYGQKDFQQSWAPKFPALSTLGVVGIVFIAMALKAKAIAGAPQMLLYILIPLTIIYAFNYVLSTVIGIKFLSRGDGIALVYGSVMRNLSIALAIAINAFGPEGSSAALVIAVAYIIQVQSAAWYVKFSDAIFGAPAEAEAQAEKTAAPTPGKETEHELLVPDFKNILYVTDLSQSAKHAAQYACSLGVKYSAQVTVMHVVPDQLEEYSENVGVDITHRVDQQTRTAFNESSVSEAQQAIRSRIESTSKEVTKQIPYCPMTPENIRIEVGDPQNKIVEIARKEGFDLIIIGTHGHGAFEDAFLGSVARDVIRKSPVPVLSVRLADAAHSR
ncbi:universal stress protein [Desulfohalobium retbaense]|uniref:Bile acid:sodium symporter n=1 Tax=Desulfohalobium retbaense (strain ATCC 49708 / DSM 5692 / JCM 16813 / HR100) TaxID=485915 RepID=C8X1R5_DESRD|nr:universal stress protein [Desulfohalobium retbaense]ACV68487.1 Bile acid:sodium symporter [Desulfohalobium retbaense DSM 5692]